MKKSLISALMVAGGLLAAASSYAGPVDVGGVKWNTDSPFDFSTTDTMVEAIANNVGDVASGYGKILNLNATGEATFCPGCELTYTFTGYTITSTAGGNFTFSGGTLNVYVDSTPNWDATLASTAGDGVLWLSLVGKSHIDTVTGNTGTLHSDPTPAAGTNVAGDGRGFLEVTGGLAAANFDTDKFVVETSPGVFGFADFLFTSSFQLIPGGTFVSDDGKTYGLFGSNDLQGNSIPVPEPGSLALVAVGMLGLARVSRRRKS